MLKIADTINRAHEETSGVCVVLENVAGGVRHHLLWLLYSLWVCEICSEAFQGSFLAPGMNEVDFSQSGKVVVRNCRLCDAFQDIDCRLSADNGCREAVWGTALSSCASWWTMCTTRAAWACV